MKSTVKNSSLSEVNPAKIGLRLEILKQKTIMLKGQNMFNESLQVYYVTYVSESNYVQDDDVAWWVDSGATVHVCKDRCWFKTYESLNDGSILHMGNESTALVHGRGCVDLNFSSGKIVTLFNVIHVPDIRKTWFQVVF